MSRKRKIRSIARLESSPSRRGRGPLVRIVIAASALIAIAVAVWRVLLVPSPLPLVSGPIVLISIDTLRADRLPVYGYQDVRTPAIDALAADAVLFERAYAHAPQTLPSHVSMLSGRLPFEHGVRDNLGFTVSPDERLLPDYLKERGFDSGGVVSSYVLRGELGLGRSFDLYDSQMPMATSEMSIGQVRRDGLASLTVAERWLDGLSSNRVFLFCHIYEPHTPYRPPERYSQYAPYDGEVAFADEIVGQLLDTLRERQLYDEATIILTSDHGEGLGDHGEREHGVFVYDESIRVPLIIKLPAGANGGTRTPQPVQHIDLVPTILDLVGLPRPEHLRGHSLRALLADPEAALPERGIYSEALYPRYHFGWSELLALTGSRYRYIRAPREELYDLLQDPDEQHNIAADQRQIGQTMRAALDDLVTGNPIAAPSAASDEDRARLEALGYVGLRAEVSSDVAGEMLPDPKDKIGVLRTYRQAVNLVGQREFPEAIRLLEQIVADNPAMADVWQQLGNVQVRAGRYEDSVGSFQRLVELKPSNPSAVISVAGSLLKLRRLAEAREHAELAVSVAAGGDPRLVVGAHSMLVRIALTQQDTDAAQRHAALAQEVDPTLPLPTYVQARMLHAGERYEEALPLFQETLRRLQARTLTLNEVHFYTADTLARLERQGEAEAEFREEVRLFPNNGRARASLAMLYRSQGKDAAVEQAIETLLRALPTPEGYGLAAQLWTIFGEAERAADLRARARERFAGDPALSELERPRR